MSMFTIEHTFQVLQYPLPVAKQKMLKVVSESTANRPNRFKAERMINSARSNTSLSISISNFILAHTDNDLAVIS